MTHTTDQERAEPIKMQPGDDLHLTMLMASHGLNFVTGKDRDQLLAWGRDVWQAARRAPAEPWQRAPLSDEQRRAIFDDLWPHGADAGIRKLFATTVFATEAAHGITQEKQG